MKEFLIAMSIFALVMMFTLAVHPTTRTGLDNRIAMGMFAVTTIATAILAVACRR